MAGHQHEAALARRARSGRAPRRTTRRAASRRRRACRPSSAAAASAVVRRDRRRDRRRRRSSSSARTLVEARSCVDRRVAARDRLERARVAGRRPRRARRSGSSYEVADEVRAPVAEADDGDADGGRLGAHAVASRARKQLRAASAASSRRSRPSDQLAGVGDVHVERLAERRVRAGGHLPETGHARPGRGSARSGAARSARSRTGCTAAGRRATCRRAAR